VSYFTTIGPRGWKTLRHLVKASPGPDSAPHLAHLRATGLPYPSKSAVPTRTHVAPSSAATSKSWVIPMESSVRGSGYAPESFRRSRSSL
jgi:hypothetical protein